jgi:hypothetical protein
MATPAEDLVTVLAAAGLGLVPGTNIFRGPPRAPSAGVPSKAVFCLGTGGYPPRPFVDGSGLCVRQPTVQITIRSDAEDFAGGEALARDVSNAVHMHPPAGYGDVLVRESEPTYLGQDEAGRHLWSINAEMRHIR